MSKGGRRTGSSLWMRISIKCWIPFVFVAAPNNNKKACISFTQTPPSGDKQKIGPEQVVITRKGQMIYYSIQKRKSKRKTREHTH